MSKFIPTPNQHHSPIIQKKKNTIIKDLIISLGKRYERLKKIPKELGIQSALPAPIPEQAPSQSSRRKRKHMELKAEIKVCGLKCNRSLPECVLFVNNMVIEEPEYEIFFTDVFGDQAFQRRNDIHKVGLDYLVSYLVMASIIKTPENARFGLKLKKLIAEHPDQEKLSSKKVKLEVVGYKSGVEGVIFCLCVLSLRCAVVKGAYGCILERDVTIMVSEPGYAL
ncbi:hypothetical protein Tco_0479252 [Tanacetum coccineum]